MDAVGQSGGELAAKRPVTGVGDEVVELVRVDSVVVQVGSDIAVLRSGGGDRRVGSVSVPPPRRRASGCAAPVRSGTR